MKQLLKPVQAAEKLCGGQKTADKEYRPTRHSLSVSCGDGTLLYHTLTGELILLSPEEGDLGALGENNALRQELIKKRFLVPQEFDEIKYSDDIHRLAQMLAPQKKIKDNFVVFTTTDCNARCFYCYEMGRSRVPMSEQTAKDAAGYIIDSCGGNKVRLRWFGGEPLYNMPAIDIITDALTNAGVPFDSSMTSNGFYLTPDVAAKAADQWKLKHIQITIDGTERVYNRTKAFIDSCDNPFVRVLDNIEAALDAGIKVFIRLNVDKNNASDMMDAVDILGRRFRGRKNCSIVIALLRTFAGKVHEFDAELDAVDSYYKLAEKISEYGLFTEKPLFRDFAANRCMADNDASEVILPDGRLGKCEHFSETELVGSIYSREKDQEMLRAWKQRCTTVDIPECADCPLYPRCINLKKCDWTRNGCPLSVRMIRTENLKRQILKEYENWKENQSKPQTAALSEE